MKFTINHATTYRYSKAVSLGPHIIRLHPRTDGNLLLLDYTCDIEPKPCLSSYCMDYEGNLVLRARFDTPTKQLNITSRFVANTFRNNDYSPVSQISLPVKYNSNEIAHLAPYCQATILEPPTQKVLSDLVNECSQDLPLFLERLNSYIYKNIQREIRHEGGPQLPSRTLARGQGACRDVSVLFMELCRAQGLAARFVSGYQAKPEVDHGQRFLHAWPEVYIPDGGWRGYDPTHGTIVNEAHVPVAASCLASGTAPVEGAYYGETVDSQMEYFVTIDAQ